MKHLLSVLSLLLLTSAAPASAETLELRYAAVMHVTETRAVQPLDRTDHVIGLARFRGLATFAPDQIAVHRYEGTFDIEQGSGTFQGYALWRFEDGSEITARYAGSAEPRSDGGVRFDATLGDIAGTGRFDGARGSGAFEGRRIEPIDVGGATYLTGALTVTLPD